MEIQFDMAPASFTVIAPPSTDIWRKPPSTNAFNAPTGQGMTGALKVFKSARIRVCLPQESELIQYDQGGILLSISRAGAKNVQWLKTGIEFYKSKPWVGTVSCDQWSDWSIVALHDKDTDGRPTVTLELERSEDEMSPSLWIYMLGGQDDDGEVERIPIREVNWIFADEGNGDVELAVHAYAARPQTPSTDAKQELEVFFDQMQVKWS